MRNFYIDLADCVTMMYCIDGNIISIEDLNYSSDLIDKLYAKMSSIKIDLVKVILHGIPSSKAVGNSIEVGTLYYQESQSDMKALMNVSNVLNIPCEFYEYAEIYQNVMQPMICIVKDDDFYRIITINGNSSEVNVSSTDYVKETYLSQRNKTGIEKLVDLDTYVNQEYVSVFKNWEKLSNDVIVMKALTIFGAIELKSGCKKIGLEIFDERVQGHHKKMSSPITQNTSIVQDLSEERPVKRKEKVKKEKVEKEKKKRKKFGLPFGFSLFLILLSVGSFAAIGFVERYVSTMLNDAYINYNTVQSDYNDKIMQLSSYEITEGSTKDSGYSLILGVNELSENPMSFLLEDGSLTINSSFRSKKDANDFLKNVSNNFSSASVSIKGEKKKFTCEIKMNLL